MINWIRNRYYLGILLFPLLVLVACSTVPKLHPVENIKEESQKDERTDEINTEALKHFMDGEMLMMQGNYPMAVLEFQDALEYDPSSTAILTSLARGYMRLGKLEKAEKILLEAITIDPKDQDARELLARQFLIRNKLEKAEEQYQYLISIYPDVLDYHYMLPEIAVRAGDFKRAQELFWKIYEEHPQEERALRNSTEIASQRGDYSFAFEASILLLEFSPDNIQYWQIYRDLALKLKKLPEAISAMEKIIELSGDDPKAREQLAIQYSEQGELDKADSLFIELYGQGYKSPAVLYFLGVFSLNRAEYESAETYSIELIDSFPDISSGYSNLARSFIYQEKPTDAISILLKARDQFPDDFDINYLLGNSYYMSENYVLAKKSLQTALQLKPDHRSTKHLLATVYNELMEWNLSDSLYQELVRTDSSDSQALNNYGYTLAERGLNLDEALEMALKALEFEPDNAAYLDTIGWIYFKMGKYKKAYEYIKKSIEKEGDNAVVLEHMGDVVSKVQGKEKALEYYKKALELDNENSRLKEKLGI